MLATTLNSLAPALWVCTVLSLVAWLAMPWITTAATRPHRPESTSAGLELGGDSPPAVAAMLLNGWKPSPTGASATLVDLAARGIVSFEPIAGGGYQVRVSDDPPPHDLLPHEMHVLYFVRSRASGGVVACTELRFTNGRARSDWFTSFDRLVASEARQRGLSRARFSATETAFVIIAATIVALVAGLAIAAFIDHPPVKDCADSNCTPGNPWLFTAVYWLLTWGGLMALFRSLSRHVNNERDTPEGLAEAGRWLGLRDKLNDDPAFATQHVDALAIWDRMLAYGVALGVATVTASDAAIGAEPKYEPWNVGSNT